MWKIDKNYIMRNLKKPPNLFPFAFNFKYAYFLFSSLFHKISAFGIFPPCFYNIPITIWIVKITIKRNASIKYFIWIHLANEKNIKKQFPSIWGRGIKHRSTQKLNTHRQYLIEMPSTFLARYSLDTHKFQHLVIVGILFVMSIDQSALLVLPVVLENEMVQYKSHKRTTNSSREWQKWEAHQQIWKKREEAEVHHWRCLSNVLRKGGKIVQTHER